MSDVAGNSADSGTKVADDGIAPTATLSVDKALSDGKITVTVETDEGIRTLSPDLALYISNGPVVNDESDVFTVELEDPDDTESTLVPAKRGRAELSLLMRASSTTTIRYGFSSAKHPFWIRMELLELTAVMSK